MGSFQALEVALVGTEAVRGTAAEDTRRAEAHSRAARAGSGRSSGDEMNVFEGVQEPQRPRVAGVEDTRP